MRHFAALACAVAGHATAVEGDGHVVTAVVCLRCPRRWPVAADVAQAWDALTAADQARRVAEMAQILLTEAPTVHDAVTTRTGEAIPGPLIDVVDAATIAARHLTARHLTARHVLHAPPGAASPPPAPEVPRR
jgi:hypothetical protein